MSKHTYGRPDTAAILEGLSNENKARIAWTLKSIAFYTQFPTAFKSGVDSVVVRNTYIWKAKVNAELKKRKAEQRKKAREIKKQQKMKEKND